MSGKITVPMSSVFDLDVYNTSVDAGHIRVRNHFELPYLIHNYTEACVWESGWNSATLACRGLVTHAVTGEVISRPFKKFFNLNQIEALGTIDFDTPVEVTEKMDGSLAILVPTPDGGYIVSTRGSFYSEQAIWATKYYANNHQNFTPNPNWTYLFEIIYANNRIVLSYDFEGLVMLGAIDKVTGLSIPLREASCGWDGRVTEVHSYKSLREVIASGERNDFEGFVIHDTKSDVRVKVKHENYIKLHRYMTNTTEKHIWEVLLSGEETSVVFAAAPDEFHQWMRIVENNLRREFDKLLAEVLDSYDRVCGELRLLYPNCQWSRGEFAELAKKENNTSLLFSLLDERDTTKNIWKALKPQGETNTMKVVSPDAT